MRARLGGDPAKPTKRAATQASPGRMAETLEIAEYANELRLLKNTWKEVLRRPADFLTPSPPVLRGRGLGWADETH